MQGIYCYRDKKDGKIVYVGKDFHIDKQKRHKAHMYLSNYDKQVINCVLQNNSDRYQYEVLRTGDFDNNLLSALEIIYIKRYGTYDNRKGHGASYGFNFTVGGDGTTGRKLSDEAKKKMSEAMKGKNNPMYGKTFSENHKRKISEFQKAKNSF